MKAKEVQRKEPLEMMLVHIWKWVVWRVFLWWLLVVHLEKGLPPAALARASSPCRSWQLLW